MNHFYTQDGVKLEAGDCYKYNLGEEYDYILAITYVPEVAGRVRLETRIMEHEDSVGGVESHAVDERLVLQHQTLFKVECPTCLNLMTCVLRGEPKALAHELSQGVIA